MKNSERAGRYLELKAAQETAQVEMNSIKEYFDTHLEAIADVERDAVLLFPVNPLTNIKVCRKEQERVSVDLEVLKEQFPEAYAAAVRPNPISYIEIREVKTV